MKNVYIRQQFASYPARLLRRAPAARPLSYCWKPLLEGVQKRHVVRLIGPPGSGKRSLAHHLAASCDRGPREVFLADGHALMRCGKKQFLQELERTFPKPIARDRRALVVHGVASSEFWAWLKLIESAATFFGKTVATFDTEEDPQSREIDMVIGPISQRPDHLRAILNNLTVRAGLTLQGEAQEALLRYRWPGQLPQLEKVISLLQMSKSRQVEPWQAELSIEGSLRVSAYDSILPLFFSAEPAWHSMARLGGLKGTLRHIEQAFVATALTQTANSLTRAAELLDVPVTTLHSKLKSHGMLTV